MPAHPRALSLLRLAATICASLTSLAPQAATAQPPAQPDTEPPRAHPIHLDGIGQHTINLYTHPDQIPQPEQTPQQQPQLQQHPATARPLILYFHGGGEPLATRLAQRGIRWTVLNARFPGLSSAYRKPFQQHPDLFDRLLQAAAEQLDVQPDDFEPILVASFSAGYGATRELLRQPDAIERIDAVVTVDSMYASYAPNGGAEHGLPLPANVIPFRQYAARAADPDDTAVFVISHSYLPPGTYAGTHETAADLLRHLHLLDNRDRVVEQARPTPEQARRLVPDDMQPQRLALGQGLVVIGCAGTEAQAHVDHLRNADHFIAIAIERLAQRRAAHEADEPARQ